MKKFRRFVIFGLAIFSSTAASAAPKAVHADFNGDGRSDKAWLLQHPDYVELLVQPGGSSKTQRLLFAVNAGVYGGLCRLPALLRAEPHDCETDTGPLPGCKATQDSNDLRLTGGDCDAIHMYWDHRDGKMAWWSR
jgi:hypothetical protein